MHNRSSKEISVFDSPSFSVYNTLKDGQQFNGMMKFVTFLVIHNEPVARISWSLRTKRKIDYQNLFRDGSTFDVEFIYDNFKIQSTDNFGEFGNNSF